MRSIVISSLLMLSLCLHSSARSLDDVKKEWITKDVELIGRLLPALARTDPSLESLEKIFGREPNEQNELGFGARTFSFSNPGGYTYFTVNGFAFNGKLGYYRVGVDRSSDWSKIRTFIIQAWKVNGQLPFTERESGITYYREYGQVVRDYKEAVRLQVGELKSVTVPRRLSDAYEYLLSLGNSSVVGSHGCDYGGVDPYGKTAIDQIVASGRIDLIENILKGYNPGGRMYALLALLKLRQNGTELSDETQNAIRVILNLDIGIETCSGCLHMDKRAKEIVSDWQHPDP